MLSSVGGNAEAQWLHLEEVGKQLTKCLKLFPQKISWNLMKLH